MKGQTVCFSHPLELELELSKKLLTAVFAEAGYFTSKAEECDIYVCFEGENGARLKSAQARNSKIVLAEAFAEYLGV